MINYDLYSTEIMGKCNSERGVHDYYNIPEHNLY